MTQYAPSPANPHVPTPTRTRLRWDNLAVLCAALAVVGGITTTIMSQGSSSGASADMTTPAVAPASTTPTADGSGAAGGAGTITDATLEDALALVSEAREFTSQGRWEEAADRLASIDPAMRPATDADVAQRELAAAQASWTRLDAQLLTQVDAEDWTGADATLTQLAELAPLGEDQLVLQDRVDAALAPAAEAKDAKPGAAVKPAATPTAAAANAAISGGGAAGNATAAATAVKPAASNAAPAAASAQPAASNAKPAASSAKPAAATTKPSANGTTTTSVGGITITVPSGGGAGSTAATDAAQLEQLLGMVATG